MKYAYFNGEIIPEEEVKINFNDLGFLRGYAVFDAMRTVSGKPFLLKAHFKRLQNSARLLNIPLEISGENFVGAVEQLLNKNKEWQKADGEKELVIKTVVSGGVSENGIRKGGEPTVLMTIGKLSAVRPAKNLYRKGCKVLPVEFQRIIPEAKTTCYLTAIAHQEEKEKIGADEIVYYWQEELLEGATSNIFLVKKGVVYTPEKNILIGTMRDLAIKILRDKGIKVVKTRLKFTELFEADEVFLTGTFKGVLPVRQINDKMVGGGEIGKITDRLQREIAYLVKEEVL
jgi:branched-subunit amino acid aminotransferase/4-amino-4-deoxychorismate lyase